MPADTEKIKRTVDEALVQAAENLAQLEHIHEVKAALAGSLVYKRKEKVSVHCLCFIRADSHYRSGRAGEERESSAGDGDQASGRQGFTCYPEVV